ncbi:hypothetical protein AGRA3207_003889 [Actinomadura graeca]|uniref:DUF4115 domain-containing protein n=1 Tax=Actinomadura graeca TaxID=2750812 RepID=A0ABX8QWX6_9ACTN|nr:hypothetical protein [Actinomadura graeca]QXJ22826.1 hypothetical protein AGRA3207_003889 [Actinomadura graeca]
MGRHRSDPRGLARILIAAVAVVAALTLLVVGGTALVNAVSGDHGEPDPTTISPTPDEGTQNKAGPSRASASPTASAVLPLVITVVGPATAVVVRVADTGEVLTQGTLSTGDIRKYEETPLQVVAANGGSLRVVIYGRQQPAKPSGQRGQWFVAARG